jgi:hypothetical protein
MYLSDAGSVMSAIRHHLKSCFFVSVAMRIVRLSHVPIKEADPSGSASLFNFLPQSDIHSKKHHTLYTFTHDS